MPTIDGTSGIDTLNGTGGADTITGFANDDTIYGGGGNDTIYGDIGNSGTGEDSSPIVMNFSDIKPGSETASSANNAQYGDSIVYQNMGTLDDGRVIEGKLTYLSNTDGGMPVDLGGGTGFEILLNSGNGNRSRYEDDFASFRLEFFDQATGEPVAINSTITFNDLDSNSANDTEDVRVSGASFTQYGVSSDSSIDIVASGSTVTASGSGANSPTDQVSWFSLSFENKTALEFDLSPRTTQSGFSMEGAVIDNPDVSEIPQGNDVVYAGDGDDTVYGGGGDDTLDGGTGNDILYGDAGNDSVAGGDGDDTIFGDAGVDIISGGDGNDTISDSAGGGNIYAGAGDDTVTTGDDNDTVIGGAGNDVISTGGGDDSVVGGDGNDDLSSGSGSDTLIGDAGSDTLDGGDDADTLYGGGDDDDIVSGAGDAAYGGGGDDVFTVDPDQTGTGPITIIGGESDEGGSDTTNGSDGDVLDLSALYAAGQIEAGSLSFTPGNPEAGTVTLTNGTVVNFAEIENFICFTRGTMIRTDTGERPIESLMIGDRVWTKEHGYQQLRWIGSRKLLARGKTAPIMIKAGAMGNTDDLMVSPQHRMLIEGWKAEMLFGEDQVLAAAKHLVNGDTIFQAEGGEVEYVHILFDAHEIVYANGAPSESFHPGEEGFDALTEDAREEVLTLFPELRRNVNAYGPTACVSLKAHEAEVFSANPDFLG